MKVKLIVDGGAMKPGPAVAQQLGPMGINLGKLISDVNESTKSFLGTKVPVEIDVDPKTKKFTIKVFSPPTSELIKKELGIEAGSGEHKVLSAGNISFEAIIGIAKTKMPDFLAKDLKSAIKMVVGSCVSLGVLIDNKQAKDIEKEVDRGEYDDSIKKEISIPSEQKKKELAAFFKELRAVQEKTKKATEEAKAAEEAAKAALVAAPGAAPLAAVAEGTAAAPASASLEGKKEEKKEPAKAAAKSSAAKADKPRKK